MPVPGPLSLVTGLTLALCCSADASPNDRARASLTWVRGPGAATCVAPSTLDRAVERRLGRPVFVARGQADVFVHGRVDPSESGWSVALRMSRRDGALLGARTIRVRGDACEALEAPLVLALVLMIDLPRADVRPPTPPPPPWRLAAEVGSRFAVGFLPGVAPALRTELVATPPRFWPFAIEGVLWPLRRLRSAGVGADVSALGAGFGVCPLSWDLRNAQLLGCAGLWTRYLRAVPVGLDTSQVRGGWELGASVRQVVSVPLSRWLALRLGVGVLIPFRKHALLFEDANGRIQRLHEVAEAAAFVDAGFSASIPASIP